VKPRPRRRPEDVVEAALEEVPKRGAVLEICTASTARLCKDLKALDVTLTPLELEQQLVDAGFTLHGSPGGRRVAKAPPLRKVADEVAAALAAKAPVFWVGTEPGPKLAGPIDASTLRSAGLAGSAILNVGPVAGIAGLVSAALLGWRRGPGRRGRVSEAWLVTGGEGDSPTIPAWQACLQRVADDAQLVLHVRHLPAGVSRWTRARAKVALVHTVLPGGRTLRTTIERVYARRPARAPGLAEVDVAEATPVSGRRAVRAEGRPASRRYRVQPRA